MISRVRFDERSAHYEVRERGKRPAGGVGAAAPDAPAPALRFRDAGPADALRLDAYDAVAGAGWFYAKSGFREYGRVRYRGDPLVYFEHLLREPSRDVSALRR